jgi:hypothetical protein
MSLRKSPELTPELVEAARRNAQHATGPRTEIGKEKVKMNAVKHGFYSAAENHELTMLALGEDPQEYKALIEQLMTSYGPGDELWCRQIEDLAKLYWRRSRLERMQTGFMRRALLRVEEWQERREIEMASATFDASQPEMLGISVAEPTDLGVRLRKTLSALGVIRVLVAKTSPSEVFGTSPGSETNRGPLPRPSARSGPRPPQPWEDRQARDLQLPIDIRQWTLEDWGGSLPHQLETLYRGRMGWRMARICHFLHQFSELCRDRDPHPDATPEAIEADLQELLRLLDEEIAALPPEIEHAEKVHAERVALERDACLAPEGETWRVMLRQESSLDRSIDRKVKIILGMRKNHIDDSLNDLTVEAGLKGDKNSEMDAGLDDIKPTPGCDSPYGEPETPEPAEHQNSRNKPGMSMKTKDGSRETGTEPQLYHTTTDADGGGGNAPKHDAA